MSNTRSKKSGAALANGGVSIPTSGLASVSHGVNAEGNGAATCSSVGGGGAGGGGSGLGLGLGGSLGRLQLKGVLDGLVKRSINEDKLADGIPVDGDVEEGARDLLELNSYEINGAAITLTETAATTGGVAQASGNGRKRSTSVRRRGRKRRRKDYLYMSDSSDDESKEKHTPHVMTLFDRKVDLARFTTTTPLYTMCRDWMSNDPNNLHFYNNSAHKHVPTGGVSESTPSLNHTEDATTNSHLPSPALPPPIPLPTDTNGQEVRLDIPKPLPPPPRNDTTDFDKAIENGGGDISAYKSSYVQRWKQVRSQWRKASALNQARYTDSLKVLREMFQR